MSHQSNTTSSSSELSWSDLTVFTKPSKKSPSKQILQNNQGIVRPGEFLAIMGPSGAGKTTLLNCLSDKYQPNLNITSGEILINSQNIKSMDYKSMIGFVPQDDVLLGLLTVRESLDFSACLTRKLKSNDRKKEVNRLIEELGLTRCADSYIGGYGVRGISGGEKKRVSIGVELITQPSVLFLDEPTTGLDSYTALSIIIMIAEIAKKRNSTIVATIHQPSSQLFMNFDRLLLLSFGSVIFMGKSKDAVQHFAELGYPIRPNYNPGDHYMNVLCSEKFANLEYRESLSAKGYKASVISSISSIPKGHYKASFLVSLYYLILRDYKCILRNPMIVKSQFFRLLITAALCSMIFADLGVSSFDLYDRYGAVYLLTNNCMITMLSNSSLLFQTVKPIFLREYTVRKYKAAPFLLSFIISRLPIEITYVIGSYGICYFVFKLNPRFESYLLMNFIGFLSAFAGTSYGILISVIAPSMEAASALMQLMVFPFMLAGGFLVSFNNVPDWYVLQYISPYRYSFEATVNIDLTDNPDIRHGVAKSGIKALHMPDSYINAIIYLAALGAGIKVLSIVILILKSRKY